MEKLNKYLTLYDKILIILIVVFSVGMIAYPFVTAYFNQSEEQEAYIYIKDRTKNINRIPLSDTYKEEPIVIELEGPLGVSVIEAHNGQVRLKKAPEKDPAKICEKIGWISKPGPSIICVPNKISIWIERSDSELDAVSW
ncbi:MAG: NusG domain II-containing protein [Halanaerobiales bacterium]|nr:NusG domain II-containing protein [Halanaerobiales bacterium]